jgi:UDPglucose 6-dehydrogenase
MAARASRRTRWPWCKTANDHGSPVRIVDTVVQVNDARKKAMAGSVIETAMGGA